MISIPVSMNSPSVSTGAVILPNTAFPEGTQCCNRAADHANLYLCRFRLCGGVAVITLLASLKYQAVKQTDAWEQLYKDRHKDDRTEYADSNGKQVAFKQFCLPVKTQAEQNPAWKEAAKLQSEVFQKIPAAPNPGIRKISTISNTIPAIKRRISREPT